MTATLPTVASVVGARPQFVKAAALSPALRQAGLREVLVHTGQHYDWAMSAAFFDGLNLPEPEFNLQIGSATHGAQTGRMLEAIERVLAHTRPALVCRLWQHQLDSSGRAGGSEAVHSGGARRSGSPIVRSSHA